MKNKTWLIIGIVALVLCCGIIIVIALVGGLLGFGLTQPAATTGEAFMTALKDGNYSKAYDLCTPDLQQELGGVQGLQAIIVDNNVQPTGWTFSSRETSGSMAELKGSVTFTGGRAGSVRVTLSQVGNNWLVAGFNLRED